MKLHILHHGAHPGVMIWLSERHGGGKLMVCLVRNIRT